MSKKIVGYCRVSTAKQEKHGHSLDAQRDIIKRYADQNGFELVEVFEEIESGGKADRPVLAEALDHCEIYGADLVVASLDRLARCVVFMETVKRRCEGSGFDFRCVDMPDANALMLGIMMQWAQYERQQISTRTKKGMAAARKKGSIFGNPQGISAMGDKTELGRKRSAKIRRERALDFALKRRRLIDSLVAVGMSQKAIAAELNSRGVKTPRGGQWSQGAVSQLMSRIRAAEATA